MKNQGKVLNRKDIQELQTLFSQVDMIGAVSDNNQLGILISKKGHIQVKMSPDKNHPLPHFHIRYKTEFSASYAIDDLRRLQDKKGKKDMPNKYERPILDWAKPRRAQLVATWEKLMKGDGGIHEWVVEVFGDGRLNK